MKTNSTQLTILGLLVLGVITAALRTSALAKANASAPPVVVTNTVKKASVSNP